MSFKTLLLIAALFIATSIAGPCGPGYVEKPDCMEGAIDPDDGNCYWAADTGSCMEIYASSAGQCADYCSSCLSCVYEYGCCSEGDPNNYLTCYNACTSHL